MVNGNEQAACGGTQAHINSLRRAVIGAVLAVALLTVTTSQATAATTDGTSNTIQFTVTSAVLDQPHHRVIVTAPATGGLTVGRHLATVEVVTPGLAYDFQDVMVESLVRTPSSSLTLNFTQVNVQYIAGGPTCTYAVNACLMEDDGIWLPGS